MPEKYYTEYYKELGTTMKEYISNLARIVSEKKRSTKGDYDIIIDIKNSTILLAEMEGKEDIKEVIYSDKNNFFGLLHISLIAEDLKAKGYVIFNHGEMYEGTFKPYFKGVKHTNELKDKMVEVLKKNLLAREKKEHDKNKK